MFKDYKEQDDPQVNYFCILSNNFNSIAYQNHKSHFQWKQEYI